MDIFVLITDASLVVKCVMAILLGASIFGWYLIFDLEIRFRHHEKIDTQFEAFFWSGTDIKTLFNSVRNKPDLFGFEAIFHQGFAEFVKLRAKNIDKAMLLSAIERMIRIAMNKQQIKLEKHLPFLASIGSVAPYIGLLGTVWGIMHAFLGLSQTQQATMASVAPGIAEALIATAIGLFAAIPAVLAFNRYTAWSEAIFAKRAMFAEELVALLQREL